VFTLYWEQRERSVLQVLLAFAEKRTKPFFWMLSQAFQRKSTRTQAAVLLVKVVAMPLPFIQDLSDTPLIKYVISSLLVTTTPDTKQGRQRADLFIALAGRFDGCVRRFTEGDAHAHAATGDQTRPDPTGPLGDFRSLTTPAGIFFKQSGFGVFSNTEEKAPGNESSKSCIDNNCNNIS